MNTLNGITVKILTRIAQIFAWPVIICGIGPSGQPVPVNVDANGNIAPDAGGVTPNFPGVGAGANGSIPTGAKGWTFTMLSGTGTFGGRNVSAGFSDSDGDILLAAISYTTNTASDAYVRYNT
jgi:hypothetical protein